MTETAWRKREREREREREGRIEVGEVCRWRTLSLILIDLLPPGSPHPFPPASSLFLFPAFQAAPTGCSVSVDQLVTASFHTSIPSRNTEFSHVVPLFYRYTGLARHISSFPRGEENFSVAEPLLLLIFALIGRRGPLTPKCGMHRA